MMDWLVRGYTVEIEDLNRIDGEDWFVICTLDMKDQILPLWIKAQDARKLAKMLIQAADKIERKK